VHKRKGQKVGALKGWEVGEIEGNGQYFAIKMGLKGGKLGKKDRKRECKLWKAGGLDPSVCPLPLPLPLHTITTTIVKKKGIV